MKITKFAIAAALSSSASLVSGSPYTASSKSAKTSADADSATFVMATLAEALTVTLFIEARHPIQDDIDSGDNVAAISKVEFLEVCGEHFDDSAVIIQGGLPWTETQCAAVFDEIDVDQNGEADGVEVEEFYAYIVKDLMKGRRV